MVEALGEHARVLVIAPESEQSACSHRISLHRALRLRRVQPGWFALDGTPADCVYVAVYGGDHVLGERPDLVVSGLNHGLNLGLDVYYSGTVAGAREGAIRGVPGLAVSADARADQQKAAAASAHLAMALLEVGRHEPTPPVLNANVPAGGSWRWARTRLGKRVYGEGVVFRRDPRGRAYLWLGESGEVSNGNEEGTDTHAFDRGEIGVSCLPLFPFASGSDDVVERVLQVVERMESARESG
jgi:5'-nucleotidase